MKSVFDEFDIVLNVQASQLARGLMHLQRYGLPIVRSSEERKQSERDTETICDHRLFVVIYGPNKSCKE